MQVLVDISTPAEVFDSVDAAVAAHFKANPKEYTGEKLVVANGATDPLKVQIPRNIVGYRIISYRL